MQILITRPREDAADLAHALEQLGHAVLIDPLVAIELLPGCIGPLDGVAALVATSRNGLRALEHSERRSQARTVPLYAVGAATAETARKLGFADVRSGGGTAAKLAERIMAEQDATAGAVLHLAGDHLAGDLKGLLEARGFVVRQPVVYRSHAATQLSAATIGELKAGRIGAVILMSPRTAETYASLMTAHGLLDATHVPAHFCLSAAVASKLAGLGPVRTALARCPNLDEILALVRNETAPN